MFNTIRKKLIASVFVIIFVLLFSSSVFQLYRSRTILLSGILDKVAHLSIPLKLNLQKNLDQFGDSTKSKELLGVYASIMGLTDFSLLTKSQNLLQKVNFVELNGRIIADSDKENLDRDIEEFLKIGLMNPDHSLFEKGNQVFIFEPFIYKEQHLGTFIFTYSNSRLIEERNRVFWVTSSFFVFFMFLGGIGAWLLSYTLSKPITYLINSSQIIADGDLDHPIDTSRKDELGVLTRSFAKMRDSIKDKINDLHSQRIYLSNIIDSMPSLLIDLDTDGKIIQWNKKAEQTTGITAGVARGKTLSDVFSADVDISSWKNALTNSEKGKILESEVVLHHKDGSSHTYLTVIYPLYDVADNNFRVGSIFTDITERKQAEDELKKHRDHLEDLVKGRTAELEEEITERKKAEEKIKASLKEKETLLHEIHHRVKNNMNVVSSLLKLQSNNIDDKQIKGILNASQSRVFAMSAVHETLHGSEKLSEIDLKAYLSKITNSIFQSNIIDHRIVKLNTNIQEIPIDINQASPLGLVINELISNSLKYAFPDEREGEINVSLKKLDEELELTVMDDGIGMPDGLDWKNSKSLGLKLVRTLVENQLDGSIEMESNNGTKFTIKFNIEN
jgi:PAS domain S-box-containing protein